MNRGSTVSLGKFCLFTTAAAIVYGIAHDMVTAHVAVAYFTVYHPHIVDSASPVVMALIWGVLATCWVGFASGIVIGICNVAGGLPPGDWGATRGRTIAGMCILWALAMCVLIGAYLLAGLMPIAERRHSFESDRRLISVALAHAFSYMGAAIMTVIVAALTWRARRRLDP